jgi:DUF917 family protein
MQIGKLLRKTVEPIKAVLKETGGIKLLDGTVEQVQRKTEAGFTFVNVKLRGIGEYAHGNLDFKAKNEVLVAYRNGRLAAIAPDIITPLNPETGKCITAETIEEGDKLTILGIPAPEKWRTAKGLELWRDTLRRSNVLEEYVPLEKLTKPTKA